MDIASLPKVVLHDHLDGGLRPATIIDLAQQQGYDNLPSEDPVELGRWFDQGGSASLERYLQAFEYTVAVMQNAPAIERVAYEAGIDHAADGAIYAEIRFAPSLLTQRGLTRLDAIEAACAGLDRAADETGMEFGVIVDAMRQESDSTSVAEDALDSTGLGVVGFDLAGPEVGFPADNHLEACQIIREANLGLTIHAGEADGLESIWTALQVCGAHRIGHGIRIMDDCDVEGGEIVALGELAAYVRNFQIPLEVCPVSGTHTTRMTLPNHPIGPLFRAGFNVSLNTDNRLMSQTSMTREMQELVEHQDFTSADLQQLTTNGVMSSFAPLDLKLDLLDRISQAYSS
jgi:adenosine deaminase